MGDRAPRPGNAAGRSDTAGTVRRSVPHARHDSVIPRHRVSRLHADGAALRAPHDPDVQVGCRRSHRDHRPGSNHPLHLGPDDHGRLGSHGRGPRADVAEPACRGRRRIAPTRQAGAGNPGGAGERSSGHGLGHDRDQRHRHADRPARLCSSAHEQRPPFDPDGHEDRRSRGRPGGGAGRHRRTLGARLARGEGVLEQAGCDGAGVSGRLVSNRGSGLFRRRGIHLRR